MANAIYPKAKEAFLSQSPALDLDSDNIKVMLVAVAQAYDQAHQYVSALTPANIIARSGNLASKSVTSGVFDAADVTFVAAPAGSQCNLILYKDTGNDSTSPLIAFLDTGTGLPVTTNGGDVIVAWDNGANKIFRL